jgi:chloramphenicol O-acetyltransferase type A
LRIIDKETWSRREHFEFFSSFNHPHFSMCANIPLTKLHPMLKQQQISLSAAIIYLISRVANEIPEFRYRIRDGTVVEHELVSPSVTILLENDLFSFCTIEYCPDLQEFAARADQMFSLAKEQPTLKDPPGRDDLLYMTAIPWVSFTSFNHPMRLHPADSIPRFAWGKYFTEGKAIKMPLSVQGHHALMDGIHVGRFYQLVEKYLDQPDDLLAAGRSHLTLQNA